MQLELETITPLFNYGAYGPKTPHCQPEIRAASIRGQLRWWMHQLGHTEALPHIFGRIPDKAEKGHRSAIVIRVQIPPEVQTTSAAPTAHKSRWTQEAFPAGTRFAVTVQERGDGLSDSHRHILQQTITAWVHLGTLGFRSTRGGGSLQYARQTLTQADWTAAVQGCLRQSHLKVWLSHATYRHENDARRVISDTLAEGAFRGTQPLGGIRPRKPSPLRLRVVRFTTPAGQLEYRIIAIWTETSLRPLDDAIHTLQQANKAIGSVLAASLPIH